MSAFRVRSECEDRRNSHSEGKESSMSRIVKNRTMALSVALGLMLVATVAQAELLVYEGFDYTVGDPLKGNDGGAGWEATGARAGWAYSNVATVREGSLTYTDSLGNVMESSGQSTAIPAAASDDARLVRWVYDSDEPALGDSPSQIWISFLVDVTGSQAKSMALFGLADNNPAYYGNAMQLTYRPNSNRWDLEAKKEADSTKAAFDYTVADGVTMVLLQIDYHETTTDMHLWINPDLDQQPELADGVGLTGLTGNYTLRALQFRNAESNMVDIGLDELHVGTTFESVTTIPEPCLLALLGAGAAMIAGKRRMIRA